MKTVATLFFLIISVLAVSGGKLYRTLRPIEPQITLLPAPPGLVPDQVIITTNEGWGSGYFAETELGIGIVTVGHVVSADMIILWQSDLTEITWLDYTCQREVDSPCFIRISLDIEPNITRVVDLDIARMKFIVWDKDRQIWLPFSFYDERECTEGTFCISGQFFDPGTSFVEVAKVRQGMSGSSPFLADDHYQPFVNDDGKLIAVGELTSGVSNSSEANIVNVFNTKFNGTE